MECSKTMEPGDDFAQALQRHRLDLSPLMVETLWLNITRMCNQACSHCHVGASPDRSEHMNNECIERCLELLADSPQCTTLDLTGGSPELHPRFEYLVERGRGLGKRVHVRHNLTVVADGNPKTGEKKGHLPQFFARQRVMIIASLPSCDEEVTDRIRGQGAFRKSMDVLHRHNDSGYGHPGSGLVLNLVYNREGPLHTQERSRMEDIYKERLWSEHGVVFNKLYGVTNMPINRYRVLLEREGRFESYMDQLKSAFSPQSAHGVACRSLINVGYDGRLYDCDFNQMLDLQVQVNGQPLNIFNTDFDLLCKRQITFGPHCFGCTAGGGSS